MVERKVQLGFRVSKELRAVIWRKARQERIRPSDLIRRILAAAVGESR